MLYDPVTRQQVEIVGRYSPQTAAFRFGKRITGESRFAKVRYGQYLPGFRHGFAFGEVRDVDVCSLVADEGAREIDAAYLAAPELD